MQTVEIVILMQFLIAGSDRSTSTDVMFLMDALVIGD